MVSTVTYTTRAHNDIVSFVEAHQDNMSSFQNTREKSNPIKFSSVDDGISRRILEADSIEQDITQQNHELIQSLSQKFQEYKDMYVATVQKAITTPVDLPATITSKSDTILKVLHELGRITSYNTLDIGNTCNTQRNELKQCYIINSSNPIECNTQLLNFTRCSRI